MKKLPTKLRRGSKDVHILSDHALQDEIEGEKTVVLTNNVDIDIGSEITTVGAFTCSRTCTQADYDNHNNIMDADGQAEASAHKTTVLNVEMEASSLQQSSWDNNDTKMPLVASKISLEDHTKKIDSEKYCTCRNEELCPCQWEENSTMVHLTNLICTSSRIWGRIQVNNVAYEKQIFVRWSSDAWKSYSEQPASFEQSATTLKRDAFTFEIERPQHGEMVELAVRYCVCNQEYWDSNDGANYQVLGTY